jgi:hypothetical protein
VDVARLGGGRLGEALDQLGGAVLLAVASGQAGNEDEGHLTLLDAYR